MWYQDTLSIRTLGRGTTNITRAVQAVVDESGAGTGLCHVFLRHTSASLILCENADPTVRSDLEAFMSRLSPDGDPIYQHTQEGADDMPAHVRTVLTQSSLTLPIQSGQCGLGTWQGIYLWEHRHHPHRREVMVTVNGE